MDDMHPSTLTVRRRKLGLSASKLATLSGCHAQTIKLYELGQYNLTPTIQKVFAKVREIEEDRSVHDMSYFERAADHFHSLAPREQAEGWPAGVTNGEVYDRTVEMLDRLAVCDRALDVN